MFGTSRLSKSGETAVKLRGLTSGRGGAILMIGIPPLISIQSGTALKAKRALRYPLC